MSALTGGQAKFASVFSRETGLNPQVVGAWLLAEQSGSAAKYYEGKGYNNWLNIGNTKPEISQRSSVWGNPESAAKASADWMRGQGQIAQEYGKPASGITAILGSHGQVPHRQIQAIANSGWAASGYEHGNTLSQLLGQVGNIPTTGPGPLPGVARQGAIASVTGGAFNNQGYRQAVQHAAGERAAASLFTGNEGGESLLRSALERAGTPPSPQNMQLIKTAGATPNTPGPTFAVNSQYVNPHLGFTQERTDMGVDFAGKPGEPIRAIGDAKVLGVSPDWYQGQPYVYYRLESGPAKGKIIYVAEQIKPTVKAGQNVRAGDPVGLYAGSGTGIEEGFGTTTGGRTLAQATTGYTEGQKTKAGEEYERFYRGLK